MAKKDKGIIIVPEQIDYALSVDAFEKSLLFDALEKSNYCISKAAVLLNLNRTTLTMILKKKKIIAKEVRVK